jgi:tetratricopeptide (TPR) repeat protein
MTFKSTAIIVVALLWYAKAQGQVPGVLRPLSANDSILYDIYLRRAIFYEPVKYDSSLYFAQKALDLATKLGQVAWMLRSTALMGQTYLNMGNEATALQYYFHCTRLALLAKDTVQLGRSLRQIGEINTHAGDNERALGFFGEALGAFRGIGHQAEMAHTLNDLGNVNQLLGKWVEAARLYQESLGLARRAADQAPLAGVLASLGNLALQQRQYAISLQYYTEALSHAQRQDDPQLISDLLVSLGRLYLLRGQPERGITYAQRALTEAKAARSVRHLRIQAKAHLILADSYFAIGNGEEAFVAQKQAITLNDSLTRLRDTEAVAKVNAGFELERKQQEMDKMRVSAHKNAARQEVNRQLFTAGIVVLSLFSLLLVAYYRRKTKTNQALARKNVELEQQKQQIAKQAAQVREANAEISRKNEILSQYAHELDAKVQARTAALLSQNEKLVEYGFINAHRLRAPVASILGLTRLLMMSPLQQSEFEVVAALDQTTKQLDGIVHEIKAILEMAEYQEQPELPPRHSE